MDERNLRVAIADDLSSARMILAEMLRRLGHQVVLEAQSGTELVEGCLRERPDLIVTDHLMPKLTGVEAAAKIYSQYPVPVILLSAYSDPKVVLTAEQKHVVVYLVKPLDQPVLEAAIDIARRRFAASHADYGMNNLDGVVLETVETTTVRPAIDQFERGPAAVR